MSKVLSDEEKKEAVVSLALNCAMASLEGRRITVSLSASSKPPKGFLLFVRGELLSVGSNGARNYSVDPIRMLAWMRKQIAQEAALAAA